MGGVLGNRTEEGGLAWGWTNKRPMSKRQELSPQGLGGGKGKDVFLGRRGGPPWSQSQDLDRKAPEGASKARPVLGARNGARPCLRRCPELAQAHGQCYRA